MNIGRRYYLYMLKIAEEATGLEATSRRTYGSVLVRSFVSYRLRQEGWSYGDIGDVAGKDHATIMHQVRKVEDMLSLPAVFKNENALYYKFERLLEDGE